METSVRIALLGPLLVDGRPWAIRSAAWRKILAVLAINAGATVSYETLIEAAGLRQASKDPMKSLRACVAGLRSTFGLAIVTDPTIGYWLDAKPDEVDVLLFAKLCGEARHLAEASEWSQVSETASTALRLYRRHPFTDIDVPGLETEWTPYLEGLWMQALTDRIRADLHLGHHESVISELENLTRIRPDIEIFWAFLMLAQYRAGSRPAANRTYNAACVAVKQEHGLDEPGEVIERIRTQIRAKVPALDVLVP